MECLDWFITILRLCTETLQELIADYAEIFQGQKQLLQNYMAQQLPNVFSLRSIFINFGSCKIIIE